MTNIELQLLFLKSQNKDPHVFLGGNTTIHVKVYNVIVFNVSGVMFRLNAKPILFIFPSVG
jgi:hypothetical protein